MKILHTSDWHLGHRLHEQSQLEEQSLFLEWLKNYMQKQDIDILLVAGDIFDSNSPSSQSQKMYYDFLVHITSSTKCKHVVIIGGNHDSPDLMNAPKELLKSISIKVVGKAQENIEDEIFELKVHDEKIIVAAVPYLRDQDIRRAIAGENFEDISLKYKTALINHYTEVAKCCSKINKDNSLVFAMGHLFAVGGTTNPDSEQTLYVGGLGDISANDFPDNLDYIALGHLHRPQKVGGRDNIRYSGSPNILSFSEINYEKNIIEINTSSNRINSIKNIVVPKFRELFRVEGDIKTCVEKLILIDEKKYKLTPWVEVIIDDKNGDTLGYYKIDEVVDELKLKVLRKSLKNDTVYSDLQFLAKNYTHVKELSPIDVFKKKCEDIQFNLEENNDVLDAFNEILQTVREN